MGPFMHLPFFEWLEKLVPATSLGCPKMTQHWKCSGIRADSGEKIFVILEIGHKIEID